ncbi:MAG: GIY-YIG nuclease family protein [Patescibacteria group bacterium]
MFTVYILKSLKNKKRYVGSTGKQALERLEEHNCGSNAWTKINGPFTLLYTEEYETNTDARRRENFLKSGQGRKWLDENIDKK